jgi:Flp pilus assembly protein TadG
MPISGRSGPVPGLIARRLIGAKRWFGFAAARRLIRQQDGVAAIEFAFVAVPFLGMLCAILQTAMVFFAGQALQTAAAASARLIMTGQAQIAGDNQTTFKQAVCGNISGLFNCNSALYVDVENYSSFSSISSALPIDANGNLINNFGYAPGGPGDIVVVRLMYEWPVYVPLLGLNLSNMSGNQRLIVATVAFRNEPY